MGIIDFGFAISDLHAVNNGVREGAREGAVGTFGSDTGCATEGLPAGVPEENALICLTKDRVGLDEDETRVKILLDPVDGYVEGAPLVICVQHAVESKTGMFSTVLGGASNASVQMRIEELGPGTLSTVAEDALPGEDWSSCVLS